MSVATVPLPRRLASLVRIEHTVFALPFAYVGAFLSVDAWPGFANMLWITVAMAGARTLAMSLNRLVDAELDARNPRTAMRELPSGALTRAQVVGLCLLALVCLPRRGVPARPGRSLALARPGRDVRRLPVPEADHVALPPLARRLPRARAGRSLARDDGHRPVGGVGDRRGRGALGRGLRSLLLALRPRARPGGGPALVGRAFRRAGCVQRCPCVPRRQRRAPVRGGRRTGRLVRSTGSA